MKPPTCAMWAVPDAPKDIIPYISSVIKYIRIN